jgi:serine/threonine-protein kinase HipA
MTEELYAIAPGGTMGRVVWDRSRDRLTFLYDENWRQASDSYPLSLSTPLTASEHSHAVIEPFLWGLLPDNDGVLKRWGQRFHVSHRHAFQLLQHVGEECAGAVQLVEPHRVAEWREGYETGSVNWLSKDQVAERMRLLLEDHSVTRLGTDVGQFSLAGAQPKTGFTYDPERNQWGVPSGRIPTTHIFKPATGAYDGFAENEHFCMRIASALNMGVARSEIHNFGGVTTIVVERYDRAGAGLTARRVHQEDMCQSLSRMPQRKYENEGGPSAGEIIDLIRQYSSKREEDETRFIDALIFNWVICGTDAHAKNYSFLIAAYGAVRLAPLYDLVSSLPYPQQIDPRKAKLAMKVASKYKCLQIGAHEWERFAEKIRVDVEFLRERIFHIIEAAPVAAREIGEQLRREISHDVISRLEDTLHERAELCKIAMQSHR